MRHYYSFRKGFKQYIIIRASDKTQFTANVFDTRLEAEQFLYKLNKDAEELVNTFSAEESQ